MARKQNETYDVFTPVGRGRGLFSFRNETPGLGPGLLFDADNLNLRRAPQFSTPTKQNEHNTQELRELIGELGSQIGESIAGRLLASQQFDCQQPANANSPRSESSNMMADLSKVSLIVKSDIKEPPMYRGDSTDKYSIQEWIEAVEVYLHKKDQPLSEQVEEVLNHLLGRAKSIVKVGLKSSSSSNSPVTPETIYNILRRYFSETPGSCLPLADFYATQPTAKETPVDYWVRLNTAAEVADKHLKCQGGKMDNMDSEIAMMFIRNCPDPDLSCVFKCKPIGKWSLTEVQEAIDEHQRENQVKKPAVHVPKAHAIRVATAVAESDLSESDIVYSNVNTAKLTVPTKQSDITVPESNALERVLSMLERVLERTSQPTQAATRAQSSFDRPSPCRVCGQNSHSTRSHCMREKRCLSCLETGHQRKDCTKSPTIQPVSVPVQSGN